MPVKEVEGNGLAEFLCEAVKDKSNTFVFSTDVVMNSWIDYLITNPEKTGLSALPLERFTAWDKFKNNFLHSTEENKTSIPSILRKVFISNLIDKNAESPFFKRIINPDFKDHASSFTDWLTGLLPSLKLWHKLKEESGTPYDDEDSDYKTLYEKYSSFLDEHDFFEPAWLDADFSGDQKFIIIYPEILEDFYDYEESLKKSEQITIVRLPQASINDSNKISCYKYSDSRKELRRTILQIRKLVEEKKASYTDITLSVPDLDTWRPYLERELTKYCIPFVIKAGLPLIKKTAGKIFTEIQDCYTSDFSFDSIRSLLLDSYIPWQNDEKDTIEQLIREGNRMHCLFNFEQKDGTKRDIWKEALKNSKGEKDELELRFYENLKERITKICNAKSFSDIQQQWNAFKTTFLDMDDFSLESNNIISRCIVHLNELIQIEKDFIEKFDLKISSPYSFFLNILNKKTYTPQNTKPGLLVYPYKLSASANYKYQFVMDASQNSIEVPNKKLSFLNGIKRKELGLIEKDREFNASRAIISLYAKHNEDAGPDEKSIVTFSFAEESFSGFEIVHNFLNIVNKDSEGHVTEALKELDKDDFILNEKNLFLNQDSPKKGFFSKDQKEHFNGWYKINEKRLTGSQKNADLSEDAKKIIHEYLCESRNKDEKPDLKDKILMTQTDMKYFFECPRKWLMNNAFNIEEDSLDTELIDRFDMGNVYHDVLEHFMKDYKILQEQLPCTNEEGLFENETEIKQKLSEHTKATIQDYKQKFRDSPLTLLMLNSQTEEISQTIFDFLSILLKKYDENATAKKDLGFGGLYVHKVEEKLSTGIPDEKYGYYGKIDCLLSKNRIDQAIESVILIDYKTSKLPAAKDCKIDDEGKIKDFQVPTYMTLINSEKKREFDYAGFVSIKDSIKDNQLENQGIITTEAKKTEEDFEPTLKAFAGHSKEFYTRVSNYDFSPKESEVDIYKDCVSCSYKAMCRYQFTVAGRNIKKGE
jgi:hypothetical protein